MISDPNSREFKQALDAYITKEPDYVEEEFAPEYSRDDKGWILFPSDVNARAEVFPQEVNSHPAKANLHLVQAIVEYVSTPEQTIMDIMGGSGTVLIGALMNRRVICIEISEKFHKLQQMAVDNIERIAPGAGSQIVLINAPCQSVLPIPADHIIFSPPYAQIMKSKGTDKLTMEKTDYNMDEYCVHPATKVLKSDLTWEPISSIKVGDTLVGIDEHGAGKHPRCMRMSVVENVQQVLLPAYSIVLDNGRVVVASGEHSWLVRNKYNYNSWLNTSKLLPGDRIKQLCEPWELDTSYEAGYLSGFLDGEGYVNKGPGLHMGFGQKAGETAKKVLHIMEKRGWLKSKISLIKSWNGIAYRSSNMAQTLQILGSIRPERLLNNLDWEGKTIGTKYADATVVGVVPIGNVTLVGISTSTRTFIAEGLVSHNSQDPLNVGQVSEFYYHHMMEGVYKKCWRSLPIGGTLTIIIKDHMRDRKRVEISGRAARDCEKIGFSLDSWHKWSAPGSVYTHIYRARGWEVVGDEDIIVLRK